MQIAHRGTSQYIPRIRQCHIKEHRAHHNKNLTIVVNAKGASIVLAEINHASIAVQQKLLDQISA